MSRWNLPKATWPMLTKYVEESIDRIKLIPENYVRLIKLIKTVAKKSMT